MNEMRIQRERVIKRSISKVFTAESGCGCGPLQVDGAKWTAGIVRSQPPWPTTRSTNALETYPNTDHVYAPPRIKERLSLHGAKTRSLWRRGRRHKDVFPLLLEALVSSCWTGRLEEGAPLKRLSLDVALVAARERNRDMPGQTITWTTAISLYNRCLFVWEEIWDYGTVERFIHSMEECAWRGHSGLKVSLDESVKIPTKWRPLKCLLIFKVNEYLWPRDLKLTLE